MPLLGQRFDALFEARFDQIGRFVMAQPSDQRAVMRSGGRELLFLSATPPPARPVAPRGQGGRALPAPLAALSAGDAALDRQIERAAKLVNAPISLLVTGETGSGKEFFAKAMHASSERRARPFVAVNCAAIPENLIESELFGHLPGSFSGAAPRGKRGLIQEADGGTLFLDEIGDMPLALQARLLRVLSEREVLPVGATKPVAVNIRVIAATHAPLETLVRAGRFRDDLYYRLNGAHITLPPLRQRSDLPALLMRFLNGRTLLPEARARLLAHAWPGNLRELKNVLDCAASVAGDGPITLHDLPELGGDAAPSMSATSAPELHDTDVALLQELRAAQWNVTLAARRLGVARMTLYRRMKRAGIVAPNHREVQVPPSGYGDSCHAARV
jgi:transcriptional regulator of acetoin/glycerol metabolism